MVVEVVVGAINSYAFYHLLARRNKSVFISFSKRFIDYVLLFGDNSSIRLVE